MPNVSMFGLLVIGIFLFLMTHEFCSCTYFQIFPQTTWYNARETCIDNGMELTMIKNEAMTHEINTFLQKETNEPDNIWIGLHWIPVHQKFSWIDNHELGQHTNWDPEILTQNEPEPNDMQTNTGAQNDVNFDNCVRIKLGYWKTIGCGKYYHVLCMLYDETTTVSVLTDATTIVSVVSTGQKAPNTFQSTEITDLVTTPYASNIYRETTSGTHIIATVLVSCPTTVISLCECEVVERNVSDNRKPAPEEYLFKVDKSKMSAYFRKRNSVYDGRYSSRVIGYTGLAVLLFVMISIVCMDINRLFN